MNKLARTAAKEVSSIISGMTAAMSAVAISGKVGVSAVGMTTGLAALGLGFGMLAGIAVTGLVGICAYNLTKYAIEFLED